MGKMSDRDPSYLRDVQYGTARRLQTRGNIHEQYGMNPYGWQRWLFDVVLDRAPAGTADVLDVGAGTCSLWVQNAARVPDAWRLWTTDFSEGMVQAGTAALVGAGIDAECSVVDVQDMPFEDTSFDLVLANHMLYHVPDRRRALREIRRILRPNGVLVASANGSSHMHEIDAMIAEFVPGSEPDDTVAVFGLESGISQLEGVFAQVDVLRYDDELRVTDAQAVVDYAVSLASCTPSSDEIRRMNEHVEAAIAKSGYFLVRKEPGVFVASESR